MDAAELLLLKVRHEYEKHHLLVTYLTCQLGAMAHSLHDLDM